MKRTSRKKIRTTRRRAPSYHLKITLETNPCMLADLAHTGLSEALSKPGTEAYLSLITSETYFTIRISQGGADAYLFALDGMANIRRLHDALGLMVNREDRRKTQYKERRKRRAMPSKINQRTADFIAVPPFLKLRGES